MLPLLAVMASAAARASCYADLQGGDAPYDEKLLRDPQGAIVALRASLQQPQAAAVAGEPSVAHREAMLLDAYEAVGDLDAAQRAYADGIAALLPSDPDALRQRLLLRHLALLADRGQIASALQQFEVAAREVPQAAPYRLCMLTDRGYLRYRNGVIGGAAMDLIRARELATEQHAERWRIEAGNTLSMVYSRSGFHAEAGVLASEALRYYDAQQDPVHLAEAYFVRGDVELHEDDYTAAAADFVRARDLSDRSAQVVDGFFARQRLCRSLVKLRRGAEAQAVCADAYTRAIALQDNESAKLVLASQGALELQAGHFTAARALLDRALANDGFEIAKTMKAEIYRDRSLVREQLGDAVGALHDKQAYVSWLDEDRAARNADQVALLRVKLATAVKDHELEGARNAALAAQSEASRQALIRNLTVVLAVLIVFVVIATSWQWRRRKVMESARHAAEERLVAISRLTGGIAHDFNNQLTVMKQAVALLQRRDSVTRDSAAVALLDEIHSSGQACAHITAQMLSFARQQNLKPEALPLKRHFDDIRLLLERTAGPGVQIDYDFEPGELLAWVDARQLTAALLNLVSNSRDAMEHGGRIVIRAARDLSQGMRGVRIDVSDNGSGMSAEVAAHAIEPFFSTKQVGSGSGLGLSMVEGFVRQSGGSISLRSEPGRGTTVSLFLPAVRPAT